MPFICVVSRTLSILIENWVRYVFWQYCSNITKTGFVVSFGSISTTLPVRVIAAILPESNLHAKSSIVAVLPDYVAATLWQYIARSLVFW